MSYGKLLKIITWQFQTFDRVLWLVSVYAVALCACADICWYDLALLIPLDDCLVGVSRRILTIFLHTVVFSIQVLIPKPSLDGFEELWTRFQCEHNCCFSNTASEYEQIICFLTIRFGEHIKSMNSPWLSKYIILTTKYFLKWTGSVL